jgi:hypothetical protein
VDLARRACQRHRRSSRSAKTALDNRKRAFDAAQAARRDAFQAQLGSATTEDERVDARMALARLDDETEPTVASLTSQHATAQTNLAKTILSIYDRCMRAGRPIVLAAREAWFVNAVRDQPLNAGDEHIPPTAGGVSMVEAKRMRANLRQDMTADEPEGIAKLTVAGFEHLNQERLKAGVIAREEQNRWLSSPTCRSTPSVRRVSVNHDEGHVTTPTKVDFRRDGSTIKPEDSLEL